MAILNTKESDLVFGLFDKFFIVRVKNQATFSTNGCP